MKHERDSHCLNQAAVFEDLASAPDEFFQRYDRADRCWFAAYQVLAYHCLSLVMEFTTILHEDGTDTSREFSDLLHQKPVHNRAGPVC